jgi:hypothetical protein
MFFSDVCKFALLCKDFTVAFFDFFFFTKVTARVACFHFPKSDVYLTNSDTENELSGRSGDTTIGELYDSLCNSESNQTFTEGSVKKKGKKIQSAKDIVS